ncbi:hypothetical protein R4P64_30385 [Rhodococcus sp. IEGM 1366]|uniref:LGFP repeat-containing protein n=1 Tax=Rhodococcus sp. IEGM 1366 TaxID=3082223 RepID=UPI00295349AA|nr:hypothetical protein [Rhodococcus sp. IEGM 1366]MDV8070836.1 hypothetical protein [Rhodococcus sp. IEGM 1366]
MPGKMRSDREEIPEGFTKEQADETEMLEARALMSRQVTSCQRYWPAPHDVCGAIRDKYNSLGAQFSFLLFPTSGELTSPDGQGKFTTFMNGPIYWSAAGGAHPVVNSILNRWGVHGYEMGWLGYPTTDEIVHADGVGRRQEFQNGAIYVAFTNAIGSAIKNGPIRDKYNALGAHAGPLGYPSSDEFSVTKNNGRYNNFVNGTITWSVPTGARLLYGPIRDRWTQLGREDGPLGYPLADEQVTPDGIAHHAEFENGSPIWWTLLTGAHEVPIEVLASWNNYAAGAGVLGYPVSNPITPIPAPGTPTTEQVTLHQEFSGGIINKIGPTRSLVGIGDGEDDLFPEPALTGPELIGDSENLQSRAIPPGAVWPAPGIAPEYDTSEIVGDAINIKDPNRHGNMVIRQGYYSKVWQDGWGSDKAEHKHQLKLIDSIEFALKYGDRKNRTDSTDPGSDFYSTAIDEFCHLEFTGYDCEEVQRRVVHAIYDPTPWTTYKVSPGGSPIGVVTAYCGGGTSPLAGTPICDSWVDIALLNPKPGN